MAYRFQKMTNSVLLSVALLFSFSVQHLSAESLVNIPDPFARKIISEANNLAGETLGTENVVSRENRFAADGQPESALTQFDLREYRLVAVSTRPTNDPSRAIIDATSAGATSATTFLPTMNFARLGQFATISLARQFAVDLYAAGQSLIYGNIIIRNNGGQFIVDTSIDGVTVKILYDTGASICFVRPDFFLLKSATQCSAANCESGGLSICLGDDSSYTPIMVELGVAVDTSYM